MLYIYIYHNSSENVSKNDLVEMADCKIIPLYAGFMILKNVISWSYPLSYWMENNFDNVFCELNLLCYQFPDSNATVWIDMFKKRANCLNMCYPPILYCWHIGCRSRVTWLCCQLIARPGSVTTMPLWPDPYHSVTKITQTSQNINTYWKLLPSFVEISLCTDYVL